MDYIKLMRLDKPISTLLLLWPTLWAVWLAADGHPTWKMISIFVTGVILMHAAGCVVNDLTDNHLDGHVNRTKYRPLVTGAISRRNAFILFTVLSVISFALTFFLNHYTMLLAAAAFLIILIYPFLKRVTNLPQLGLGVAFAWAIPMAFAASNNAVSMSAWILFIACIVWTIIHDTIYAMFDRVDDMKVGIKSSAILFGRHIDSILLLLQCVFIILLTIIGIFFKLHIYYYLCLILTMFVFLYQQYLLHKNISLAYQTNNWIGFIIFLGILT